MKTVAIAESYPGRVRRVRERPSTQVSTITYLESSAVVAALLERDTGAKAILAQPGNHASTLTFAEARRAIIRATIYGRISAEEQAEIRRDLSAVEDECVVLPISDDVLARAGRRFPIEPIRTLDSIHLATAEQLLGPGTRVMLLTRDDRLRENALALGIEVL